MTLGIRQIINNSAETKDLMRELLEESFIK